MAKRVIIDFDNTMGVRGCDVDDGLALLFLLGTEGVSVEAACTAYGNSTIGTVHENTLRLFAELGIDVPVYRGAAGAHDAEPSEAARFLVRAAAENPGELSIVATGSMTNLGQAMLLDPSFGSNVREIAVMGGVTQSLYYNGRLMDELNLSCDAASSLSVLTASCPVFDATAQACAPAFFRREDFEDAFGEDGWLTRAVDYWFADMGERYLWDGFICWDVVAAAAVARPDLMAFEEFDATAYERFLSVGYLEEAHDGSPSARILVPRIDDASRFVAECVAAWARALERLGVAGR